MKKITLIKSLLGFSLLGGAFITIVSTTTNCGTPEVAYNATGTNWKGYIRGTLTCTLNEDDKTCTISANNNYAANSTFAIPEKISVSGNSYTVVTIGNEAFKYSSIVGINLNKVTTIGDDAFQDCVELKGADFGAVATIGETVFTGCATLATINLRNVNSIGNAAFFGVPLSKISLDENNSTFELEGNDNNNCYVHKKAEDITNVTAVCGTYGGIACGEINNSNATNIGDYAFYGSHMTVFMATYLSSVGAYAFADCYSLHSLYLGIVKTISNGAFARCPLSSVGISLTGSTNYKWIGQDWNNGYLKKKIDSAILNPTCGSEGGIACGNVSFNDGETTLASKAFYEAEGITSIVFNTVTTFQSEWNYGCMNLYSVTIGAGNYFNDGDNGWNHVGPDTGCILNAPSNNAGESFMVDVIGEQSDKWEIVVNS